MLALLSLPVHSACAVASLPAEVPRSSLSLPLLPPLAPDGVLHSFAGTMTSLLTAAVASQVYGEQTVRRYPLLLPALGFSMALAAGIGKETLDSTGFGDPQWSDIMHTLLGGLLGAAFIGAAEFLYAGRRAAAGNEGSLFAAVGLTFAVPVGIGMINEIRIYLHRRRSAR